jgi:hypothetical protein
MQDLGSDSGPRIVKSPVVEDIECTMLLPPVPQVSTPTVATSLGTMRVTPPCVTDMPPSVQIIAGAEARQVALHTSTRGVMSLH